MPRACRGAFATSTVAAAATTAAAAPLRACEIFALHALLRGPCKWWPWRRRRHTVQQARARVAAVFRGWLQIPPGNIKEVKALCWPWKADCLTTTVYANFEGCRRRGARRGWCFFRPATMATREPSATGAAAASHGTRRQRGHVCFHSRIAESASTWQRKKAQARELSERGIVSELRALSALPFYRSLSALPPACPALSLARACTGWLAPLAWATTFWQEHLWNFWSILKLSQIWMFRIS